MSPGRHGLKSRIEPIAVRARQIDEFIATYG
jgi:hypothetical protein